MRQSSWRPMYRCLRCAAPHCQNPLCPGSQAAATNALRIQPASTLSMNGRLLAHSSPAPPFPLQGILSDLFPGIDLPEADYTSLNECLVANCVANNLQPVPAFLDKTRQLCVLLVPLAVSVGGDPGAWQGALAGL